MPTELHRNWQGEKENCLIPSPSFNIFMYAGNQDWLMVCCRFPAGIVWPVILLVLIGSVLVTAGCVQDSAGSEEITFPPTPEPAVSIQGLVARPVTSLDKSIIRSTTISVIRTTNTMSWTGPAFNATGSEINMSTVGPATETIPLL